MFFFFVERMELYCFFFFFSSRRRHTRFSRDWSSDVCSSDLRLHEKGQLTDGNMVEFLRSHTNVIFQPDFDDPRYSGINPYSLGFAMMSDIERICTEPTAEDQN